MATYPDITFLRSLAQAVNDVHNIGVCLTFTIFVRNCYTVSTRLFVIGGTEIESEEDTTQGDPLGMDIYAIGTPLLDC